MKEFQTKKVLGDLPEFTHSEDSLPLYGGSDLDKVDKLVDLNHDIVLVEEDNLRDNAINLVTFEKIWEPISTELAKIVNNVLVNPINSGKLIKKSPP